MTASNGNNEFAGKVALVTGAASGIGRATALAFSAAGASVLVSDVQEEAGEQTVGLIRAAGGRAKFVRCDVSHEDEVEAMVERCIESFGRLDFACNNAGIEGASSAVTDLSGEEWNRILAVNLTGTWYCMRHELPVMLRQGGGSVVNVASIAGVVGFPNASAYVASKHGVVGLTRSAALEYARQGIRINVVCPGVIETPMITRATGGDATAAAQFAQGAPAGRMGQPEEIASAVLWLCSAGAGYTIGHPLVVDGGWTVQ